MRFAIINSSSLLVTNVCEWDGAEWLPPFGTFVVETSEGSIGDTYDPLSNSFIRPPDQVQEEE